MKISALRIINFKAIRNFEMTNLGDVVVVAGPNGCGKSCILDAIRFLKSAYAGYRQQNEWHNFFNEFQLNMQNVDEVYRLFFDRRKPVTISAQFVLSDDEKKYIEKNAKELISRNLSAQAFGAGNSFLQIDPHDGRVQEIHQLAAVYSEKIIEELRKPSQNAELTLGCEPALTTAPNLVLQFAFSIYDPAHIGIIDYHSANRTYHRERVGGVNVSIEETSQRLAQHALYNWQNKYVNIKSELASAYIRDIFVEKAGGVQKNTTSILKTLEELFDHFLPGKTFNGPIPGTGGELTFPVKLNDGGEHDIDDLSSGEKELVYGYLRLRNIAPTNSIILLDEPELHLNPRLIMGLPSFYRRHLGLDLKNQLWMTTHSDAFLREAYRGSGFTIFHMSPAPAVSTDDNQVVAISAESEINRAIVDLVGDIAGFRPGNVLVIFESSEDASFDASMTKRLFPDFAQRINAISGDNKSSVKQLYAALNKATAQMALPLQIYAIVDKDTDGVGRPAMACVFSWNVYHIENYLLDENFIAKVMEDYPTYAQPMRADSVLLALCECARECQLALVRHRMHSIINGVLTKQMDLGFNPKSTDLVKGFTCAVRRVNDRIRAATEECLSENALRAMNRDIKSGLDRALQNGSWRSEFRGRDILKMFAARYLRGLPYEAFRDAIIARMSDVNHKPAGMNEVIAKIAEQAFGGTAKAPSSIPH
jgi:predicted ATPase